MEKSEIAARGWRDHVLIVGAPGSGKTVWAHRQATKVPIREWDTRYSDSEFFHRVAGYREDWEKSKGIMASEVRMPFRAPHHSVSLAGLTGCFSKGWKLRPGELSLAHGGVLLLDEAQEFRRELLEEVARVVRAGYVVLGAKADDGERLSNVSLRVPAEFRLIVACSPCPCGWRGHPREGRSCRCTDERIARHMGRLGPLLEICRTVPAEEWQAEVAAMTSREAAC